MFRNVAIMGAALAVLASGGLTCGATDGLAQTDPYAINYFVNANTAGPADTVRIVDPDEVENEVAGAAVCANIFVFDTIEELAECCACPITPGGRLDFNVNTNLTANPLTGVTLINGVIKIIRTNSNPNYPTYAPVALECDPTNGATTTLKVAGSNPNLDEFTAADASLLSWTTHDEVRGVPGSSAISEEFFQSTDEGSNTSTEFLGGDLAVLQSECASVQIAGDGVLGVCTCPAGPVP